MRRCLVAEESIRTNRAHPALGVIHGLFRSLRPHTEGREIVIGTQTRRSIAKVPVERVHTKKVPFGGSVVAPSERRMGQDGMGGGLQPSIWGREFYRDLHSRVSVPRVILREPTLYAREFSGCRGTAHLVARLFPKPERTGRQCSGL